MSDEWKVRAKTYDNIAWVTDPFYLEDIRKVFVWHGFRTCPNTPVQVLEIGCGTGAVINHLYTSVGRGDYHGVDSSADMLEIAKQKNPVIDFRIGDIRELPYSNDTFDCVIGRLVFHHFLEITEVIKIFQEARRVLKPDGTFIFIEGIPIKDRLLGEWKELINKEDRNFYDHITWKMFLQVLFKMDKEYLYTLKQQSIRNWLDNSVFDEAVKKRVTDRHNNLSADYKKLSSFTIMDDGDVRLDWLHYIAACRKVNT